jgi:hypothetical protein
MKRLFRHPLTNAVCVSLFTAFYALVFFTTARSPWFVTPLEADVALQKADSFWAGWSGFLANGSHGYIAYAMIATTILVFVLLMTRRHPYDEYHTSLLTQCLAVASVLTLVAIAAFYLMILQDPSGIVAKFTLFITVHWTTVVLSDLAFVLLCRWK